ncbi:MAG TPA: 4-hydroxy-tetrahydrodipicolinate synthase [Tepidisphaeraceae bacterium]|jgi:4-hydroxy-tetrahydrodipicolinate synthase|nr:4-hydroxy-tetrahydrodipicolinate synthase [Tepidisphaeraceae bacterium]
MFKGALTAMVSPFRAGRLDEARLREQIEFQIAGGIDGLVPVGTTGESPTLDFREHERVIELTVQTSKGRVPVIAGTGGNATSEALGLHQFARDVGADACLSVNPYYNKPTQEGLYRHFMTLADKVPLPIVLYNIPGRTGITMAPQTVARLFKHENIVAIKESTGVMDIASEIRSLCEIPILSGDDSLTLPLMSVGAGGVISVAANVIPSHIKQLVKLIQDNSMARAATLHVKLFPFIKTLFLDGNPVGVKHAMKLAGLDTGELRLPLWEASDATKAAIEEQMRKLDIPIKAT